MDLGKGVETAQLNGLFPKDGLREMLERNNYYAVDWDFQCTAAFIDRSLGFEARCDLSQMTVQYSDIANRILIEFKDEVRVRKNATMVQNEIEELKVLLRNSFRRTVSLVCIL